MTTYYTLVPKTDAIVGRRLDTQCVTDNPRRLPAADITDGYSSPTELATDWKVARLAPVGAVNDVGAGCHDADSWEIAAVDPIDAFLGPQAALILTADRVGEEQLNGIGGDPDSPEEIFGEAVNAQYEDDTRATLDAHLEAVEDVLGYAGFWWMSGAGDVYGAQIVALAARDLIGSTPGWTQAAYDFLTAPWVAALGPIHPDDHGRSS